MHAYAYFQNSVLLRFNILIFLLKEWSNVPGLQIKLLLQIWFKIHKNKEKFEFFNKNWFIINAFFVLVFIHRPVTVNYDILADMFSSRNIDLFEFIKSCEYSSSCYSTDYIYSSTTIQSIVTFSSYNLLQAGDRRGVLHLDK